VKVLIINGSPNMDKGNTALILAPFVEGIREAGAEVEVLYTKKLKINPCQGELSCWIKTPGVCFQHDDMDWLLPKFGESDILVVAAPLYVDGMPGPVKNLIDRLVPRGVVTIEIRDGRCRHPIREGLKPLPIVLVSSCGFWEIESFDPLLAYMKAWSNNGNSPFLGAVLRPTCPMFRAMLESGAPFDDVLEAAKEAGRQLITTGEMSRDTLATVSRPLMSREEYVRTHNEMFAKILADLAANQSEGVTH
jgi:multimeric flavodoxin WrbA